MALQRSGRVRLLGGDMDLITGGELIDFVAGRIAAGRKAIVANHNTHSLVLARRDPAMSQFYAIADLIEIDSMPVVAWGRLTGTPVRPRHRCTYLDWRGIFWRRAQAEAWRIFYLGGRPQIAERAADRLMRRHPGVTIATRHGYFGVEGAANDLTVESINAFAPDILFVGLGMPLQERWIAANHHRLKSGVVFSVGGAFDYEAGVRIAAPRWISAAGFEWLFRCLTRPSLIGRYLIEPWTLVGAAADDLRRAFRSAGPEPPPREGRLELK